MWTCDFQPPARRHPVCSHLRCNVLDHWQKTQYRRPERWETEMSFLLLCVLLVGGDALQAPPRDLLSLLDAQAALVRMGAPVDEDGLMAILSEQPDAVGLEGVPYVRKLLAIRALEQMNSCRAVPTLEAVAAGQDVTLCDAAAEAIAAIRCQKGPRPSGSEALKGIARLIPDDAGFVLVADWERGSCDATLGARLKAAGRGLGNNASAFMGAHPGEPTTQAEKVILDALGQAGNFRLDALAVVCSNDLGASTGYVCAIVKGLYDPSRMAKACQTVMTRRSTFQTHTVYYEPSGPAVCLLDERTAVVSFGPGDEAAHMFRALTGILAERHTPAPSAAKAFEIIAEQNVRFAVSGALSKGQREEIRNALGPQVERLKVRSAPLDHQLGLAACEAVFGLAEAGRFAGRLAIGGDFAVTVSCPDAQAAAGLGTCLSGVQKLGRQVVLQRVERSPMSRALCAQVKSGARLWESSVTGTDVIVRIDPALVRAVSAALLAAGARPLAPPQVAAKAVR